MHFRWAFCAWAGGASAAKVRHRNGVHSIPKEAPETSAVLFPQPTAAADFDWRILARAQTTQLVCATGYSLCPQSLSGGCCTSGYACAANACTATTSGPTTCQGTSGAYACPSSLGGGCCLVGYICTGGISCLAPVTATPTYTCLADQYMCAASFGFGCCRSGYGCATNSCYRTAPSTVVSTQTTTISDGSVVLSTITNVYTPEYTSAAGYDATEVKYKPQTVDKASPTSTVVTSATSTSTSHGESLSTGAIIGISIGTLATVVLIVCALLVTCGVWNIADTVHKTAKHVRVRMHSGRPSRHGQNGYPNDNSGSGGSGSVPTYPNMSNSVDATLIEPTGRNDRRGHRYSDPVGRLLMATHQRSISDDRNAVSPYDQMSNYTNSVLGHSVRSGRRPMYVTWKSRQNQQYGNTIQRPSHPRNFSVDSSASPSMGMVSPSSPAEMNLVQPVVHVVTHEPQELPLVHDRGALESLGSDGSDGPLSPTDIGGRAVTGQYVPVDQNVPGENTGDYR